jgi:hypothetical protein
MTIYLYDLAILLPNPLFINFAELNCLLKIIMKESGKENRCETHSLPLIKIDLQTHRLLCEKCLSESDEDRRQRLEMLRLKLTKNYQL